MSHTTALRRRLAILAIGTATAVTAFAGSTSSASALIRPTSGLVNAPDYCLALYGSPDPCPLGDRPTPVDSNCLRVDVDPLMCPYQP